MTLKGSNIGKVIFPSAFMCIKNFASEQKLSLKFLDFQVVNALQ